MADLPIIGRERAQVDRFTKALHSANTRRNDEYTDVNTDGRRSARFDVHVFDGREPTGAVLRVTVEYLRLDNGLVEEVRARGRR